jgi:hypothetical protein
MAMRVPLVPPPLPTVSDVLARLRTEGKFSQVAAFELAKLIEEWPDRFNTVMVTFETGHKATLRQEHAKETRDFFVKCLKDHEIYADEALVSVTSESGEAGWLVFNPYIGNWMVKRAEAGKIFEHGASIIVI